MEPIMIRDFLPRLSVPDPISPAFILCAIAIIIATAVSSFVIARFSADHLHGNRKRAIFAFMGISALSAAACVAFYGMTEIAVKGILFCLILLFASYEDIKKRECDDFVHVLILVAAFIATPLSSIPHMFFSAMVCGGIMLLTMLLTKCNIGGADIKLATVCAFLIGPDRGLIGLLVGTVLALVCNAFKKDRKAGFPMIPYLSVGFMAAYFIQV